ncbi:hypothetical protein Tco_1513053, partial [Tanacetum coccineum]
HVAMQRELQEMRGRVATLEQERSRRERETKGCDELDIALSQETQGPLCVYKETQDKKTKRTRA